nr:immunoglobulin heavy chain junction region [Mus musculus]MBK4189216.1 immunoglobulin heavy chain junction region [Mus musculus]
CARTGINWYFDVW